VVRDDYDDNNNNNDNDASLCGLRLT